MMRRRRLKPLKSGDTIAVVAPSSPTDPKALERGVRWIERLGLRVRLCPSVDARRGYLAGEDALRAEDFMRAWEDPDVRAVWAARGGYGAVRILDRLDVARLRPYAKWLLGYSDVTALHAFVGRTLGLITLHAPVVERRAQGVPQVQDRLLADLLFGRVQTGPMLAPYVEDDALRTLFNSMRVLAHGSAAGALVGGNLSLVASLLGTPWEVDTRGKILFLEDVGEAPYRIDRLLCQLKLAGKLDAAAGILLGTFTDCEPGPNRPSLSLEDIWADYFSGMNKPVVIGFPAGHSLPNLPIPLGAHIRIETDPLQILLVESLYA